jgi:hypothetical protein
MTPRLDPVSGQSVPRVTRRQLSQYRQAIAKLEDVTDALQVLYDQGVIPSNYATAEALDDLAHARRAILRNARL